MSVECSRPHSFLQTKHRDRKNRRRSLAAQLLRRQSRTDPFVSVRAASGAFGPSTPTDCEHAVYAIIPQTFPQYTLPNHSCRSEQNYFHGDLIRKMRMRNHVQTDQTNAALLQSQLEPPRRLLTRGIICLLRGVTQSEPSHHRSQTRFL